MKRYRFYFSRDIDAAFISHLDMMRLFERIFRRLGVRLKYTEGFNPHPKISFILPMSVGLCSDEDIFEVDIEEPVKEDLISKINTILPKGLNVLKIEEAIDKIQINNMYYKCILEAEKTFCDKFDIFMEGEVLIRRSKKGKDVYKNAKDYLLGYNCSMINDELYQIDFHVLLKDGSFIRPEDVINSFADKYNLTYRIVKVIREKIIYQRVI